MPKQPVLEQFAKYLFLQTNYYNKLSKKMEILSAMLKFKKLKAKLYFYT